MAADENQEPQQQQGNDSSAEAPQEEVQPKQQFSLNIFQTLDQAQSNHGIPHQDYAQYHKYCTDRLDRIRHFKAVKKQLVHNSKYVEGGSDGRRNVFCPRKTPEIVEHEYVLWNLLVQAERAWAQASALQASKESARHAYIQRRLNKAVKHANEVGLGLVDCIDQIPPSIHPSFG